MIAARSSRIAALGLLAISHSLPAAEGAVSLYAPGFFSSTAGVFPEVGNYADFQLWIYDGQVENAFLENQVVSNVDSSIVVPMVSLLRVTEMSLLGGQYGFSVMASYPSVDVEASLQFGEAFIQDSDSSSGIGDVTLTPLMLGWHNSDWHSIFMINVYVPTGSWDEDDLATNGLNRWAVEPMYNATYLSEETGREFSMAAGYTINFRNEDTDYESGDEFHLDLTLAQWFPNGWMAGAAGYWFKQLTDDKGAPPVLGGNKGEVFGIGPIVSYLMPFGPDNELLLSARYYHEFSSRNRTEGDAIWLRASLGF